MSSKKAPLVSIIGDMIRNVQTIPLQILLEMNADNHTVPALGLIAHVYTSTGITTAPSPVHGFSKSFVLHPNNWMTILLNVQGGSETFTPNLIYIVSITQAPIQAGGGRILDVSPILKDKRRKSSIRVKKGRKQTAKYKNIILNG